MKLSWNEAQSVFFPFCIMQTGDYLLSFHSQKFVRILFKLNEIFLLFCPAGDAR